MPPLTIFILTNAHIETYAPDIRPCLGPAATPARECNSACERHPVRWCVFGEALSEDIQ